MANTSENTSIDSILESFDLSACSKRKRSRGRMNKAPVTFWLPEPLKDKFSILQRDSQGEFGQVLKKILMAAIEKTPIVEESEEAG